MIRISRGPDGSYNTQGQKLPPATLAVKRPIPIEARRMSEPFVIESPGCVMEGRAGDWLLKGADGELYLCPADTFAKTYDTVPQWVVEKYGSVE